MFTKQVAGELTRTAKVCALFCLVVGFCVGERSCRPVYVLTGSQSGLLWSDKDAPHPPFTGPVKMLSPTPHQCAALFIPRCCGVFQRARNQLFMRLLHLLNVQSAYKRGGTGTGNSHFLKFWSFPDEDAQTKWRPKPAAA